MFYFTPAFSRLVKDIYLKVSSTGLLRLWQNIFFHHPGVQFEDQASHLDHGIAADQLLRFFQRAGPQNTNAADLSARGMRIEQGSVQDQPPHLS